MKVLIACEESQEICSAFRRLGHEAYSCDLQECSGGHPEWHICDDALRYINGECGFFTSDGAYHAIETKWDLLIAHPPCTYLSCAGNRHLSLKHTTAEKVIDRQWRLAESAVFFMQFALADCEKICIENPLGYMSRLWRTPDQIIHPYFFAQNINDRRNYQLKRTCLWLKNLPPLLHQNNFPPPAPSGYTSKGKALYFTDCHGKIKGIQCDSNSAKARSKTFPGVAQAMALQWGGEDD